MWYIIWIVGVLLTSAFAVSTVKRWDEKHNDNQD